MQFIYRIDVDKSKGLLEKVPVKYEKVGGRSLIAKLLLDEVEPTCDPLGRHNKLIIATGLPCSSGKSICSTLAKNASISMCIILFFPIHFLSF